METRSHTVCRHESARGRWEMVVAAPPPALRGLVRAYTWWTESVPGSFRRRELPLDTIPLIFNFGPRYRISAAGGADGWTELGSFTTGVYDRFVLVESRGLSACIQVNLTLPGARLLIGRPLGDLANRAVEIADLFGPDAERLETELYDAHGWKARFAILDRELEARLIRAIPLPRGVHAAWRCLAASGGAVRIRSIVDEVGWSHRHLIAKVTSEFGLGPKALARVLRFSRAVRAIRAGRVRSFAELAHGCGYYDQPHFVRECRALAGDSPTGLVRSLLPDGGGFLPAKSDSSKPERAA